MTYCKASFEKILQIIQINLTWLLLWVPDHLQILLQVFMYGMRWCVIFRVAWFFTTWLFPSCSLTRVFAAVLSLSALGLVCPFFITVSTSYYPWHNRHMHFPWWGLNWNGSLHTLEALARFLKVVICSKLCCPSVQHICD